MFARSPISSFYCFHRFDKVFSIFLTDLQAITAEKRPLLIYNPDSLLSNAVGQDIVFPASEAVTQHGTEPE